MALQYWQAGPRPPWSSPPPPPPLPAAPHPPPDLLVEGEQPLEHPKVEDRVVAADVADDRDAAADPLAARWPLAGRAGVGARAARLQRDAIQEDEDPPEEG